MPDTDFDADDQDLAEAFDETHREDEDPSLFDEQDALDPDLDSRAYDSTRANGDAGPEDEDDEDEDDLDDDDLDDLDDEEDEEDEEDYVANSVDETVVSGDTPAGIVSAADEPDLTLVEDLDAATGVRNRDPRHFESRGPLSDEEIAELGYGAPDAGPKTTPR